MNLNFPSLFDSSLKETSERVLTQSETQRLLVGVFGRNIVPIIAGYLGNSYFQNSRIAALVEGCRTLIQTSNRQKASNEKACVILQSTCDSVDALTSISILPQIALLARTHYVVFQTFNPKLTSNKFITEEIIKELEGRPIMTLIIRAHGKDDLIHLDEKRVYRTAEVREEDFRGLDPNASIIFESCCVGRDLAKRIAAIQQRPVFAAIGSISKACFISCCQEHGIGMLAYDEEGKNMIARRFQKKQETLPCCSSKEMNEKILQNYLLAQNQAAQLGDAVAQFRVGCEYHLGNGYPQSIKEAVKWYEKAAASGFPLAQHNLAQIYFEHVPRNYEKGFALYLKAAEELDESQNSVGIAYAHGYGIHQSHEEAFKWYRKAAKSGNMHALFNLGVVYSKGCGIPQDYEKAVKVFQLGGEAGDSEAQYQIGVAYYFGKGIRQSYFQAVTWFQKAALQGHKGAQYNLGCAYSNGEGVSQCHEEASKWFEKAAVGGDLDAQHQLGRVYSLGKGVSQSYSKALFWLREAAGQGHAGAQYDLGLHHLKGLGVQKSDKNALYWIQKAADQGYLAAERALNILKGNDTTNKNFQASISEFFLKLETIIFK